MEKPSIKKQSNTAKSLVYIALFSVVIAVCSWICIPTVVPFTMQTFAVFFAVCFLGGKKGTICIATYLLLGIVGLPVFAGGRAGVGVLFGASGGYMVGWLFVGAIYALFRRCFGDRLWVRVTATSVGLLLSYAIGTAWLMVLYANSTGAIGLFTALGICVFPFIVPDAIKIVLAIWLAGRFKKFQP